PRIARSILGICAKFTKKALEKHRDALVGALCDSLDSWDDYQDPARRLEGLASKISDPQLVKKLHERYPQDDLKRGRGAVAAAALKAHGRTDIVLTEAYLVYARYRQNVNSTGPCIEGLRECAGAGFGSTIASRIACDDVEGYNALAKEGLLLDIFGSAGNAVALLCEALDAESNEQRLTAAAGRALVGLIGTTLPGSTERRLLQQLGGNWPTEESR
ncbi:unnamed protein product, partial [marine sediment metagenome]